MILLHGAIFRGRLWLWGEIPPETLIEAAVSRPKKAKRTSPSASSRRAAMSPLGQPRSPYAADAETLKSALESVGFLAAGSASTATSPHDAAVWMPSLAGAPIASSTLIAPPPESRSVPKLQPFAVAAIEFNPTQALQILCRVTAQQSIHQDAIVPGVILARDLAYCGQVMRMAGAMVAQQQVLPSLTQGRNGWRAVWSPVFLGDKVGRLNALADAMPGSVRSLVADGDSSPETTGPAQRDEPPASDPRSLLREFLGGLVDSLVRQTATASMSGPRASIGPQGTSDRESLHDDWLAALLTADGMIPVGDDGAAARESRSNGALRARKTKRAQPRRLNTPLRSSAELADLAEAIRQWQRPIAISSLSPVQLCFRLDPPTDPASPGKSSGRRAAKTADWQVRYFLQALDDPSLRLPALEVWGGRRPVAQLFRGRESQLREYLLTALGQASAICPRIEQSLKSDAPDGYALDTSGAYDFLSGKAMLLEQAGFGVMVPSWWTGSGTRLKLAARAHVSTPSMKSAGRLSLDEIVRFNWQVALGDKVLSRSELQELVRLKTPLLQVRGEWVQVTADQLEAALALTRQGGAQEITARAALRLALGAGEADAAVGSLEFDRLEASGWMAELLERLQERSPFEICSQPAGILATLRPYQLRGYSWLRFLSRWGLGACLADDMGLGKTLQTLAWIADRWQAGPQRPTLLVCPTSVLGNWQKEAQRFAPELPLVVHHGTDRLKGTRFRKRAESQAMVLTSYGLLPRDVELFRSIHWACVVLDEAQNVKNASTKQAQAARTLESEQRIALTGTPVENNVGDLWSISEFLNPGLLGTQQQFKRRFFLPIQAQQDAQAAQQLRKLTGPFVLRRMKTDRSIISDLPEKLEMKVYATLTREQVSLYEAVVQEAERAIFASEGIERKGLVLATLMRLKQVCNHPRQLLADGSPIAGRSGKLARLTEMIQEVLAVQDHALVFTQFTEMGQILQRHLQESYGREVLFLHGGLTKKQRDKMVERFQGKAADSPLMVLSLKAGGTGLNLTAANHVFHFDRWWNPAVEDQATDRAFRIGQTRNVQVHKFVCLGTVEEKIDEMIEQKKDVSRQVIGSGEAWLTELSNRQLRDLFALRKTALAD